MKLICTLLFSCLMLLFISGCNSADRLSVLKHCTVLGDESIIYARAHYVKLFYHFNPSKFADSYNQIKDFDKITHKNTIDTYVRAIDKLIAKHADIKDSVTNELLRSCKELSEFSKNFVENDFPTAMNFKSKKNPATDGFFIEINQIVMFDHNIGSYDKNKGSFKRSVDKYKQAVNNYIKLYRKSIPSEFVKSRNTLKPA